MQRVGASYVGKKIYDYLMTQPEKPAEAVAEDLAELVAEPDDELDGQPFHDEDGQPLGIARRVPGLAVYLVSDGHGNPAGELARYLADPETRLFWRETDGRITALFYVPDPSRVPERPRAMRADDV